MLRVVKQSQSNSGDSSKPKHAFIKENWENRTTLRWRVAMLSASMVAIAVGMMTMVGYWSVTATLTEGIDRELRGQAELLLDRTESPNFERDVKAVLASYHAFNPDTYVSVRLPNWNYAIGDDVPSLSIPEGDTFHSATLNNQRVLVMTDESGATVVLSRNIASEQSGITSLGVVVLVAGVIGILAAIIMGIVVSHSSLKPLAQLKDATLRVAHTQDLTPLPVPSEDDEIAQLTNSFNKMLLALDQSIKRQAQLVSDAGHELKTPLTSMRTNIELLILLNKPGSPQVSEEERVAIEKDVMAQMNELSTLIGDLVDLSREESRETIAEEIDLTEIAEFSLDRVRRRRADVRFEFHPIPWSLEGDAHSLGRAIVNLLDNAAKWSPPGGVVRMRMFALDVSTMQFTISDNGPGIPEAEREKVFQRFYRAVSSRSMPGSGLGLAIVKQAIERHGGTIVAEETLGGGTTMRVTLPGSAIAGMQPEPARSLS